MKYVENNFLFLEPEESDGIIFINGLINIDIENGTATIAEVEFGQFSMTQIAKWQADMTEYENNIQIEDTIIANCIYDQHYEISQSCLDAGYYKCIVGEEKAADEADLLDAMAISLSQSSGNIEDGWIFSKRNISLDDGSQVFFTGCALCSESKAIARISVEGDVYIPEVTEGKNGELKFANSYFSIGKIDPEFVNNWLKAPKTAEETPKEKDKTENKYRGIEV